MAQDINCEFFGVYDVIPDRYNSNVYTHQNDFGFVRNDGLLVISPKGTPTDGASVPRFAWAIVGHPMHGSSKFWGAPHDSLYNGSAIIVDTPKVGESPRACFESWDCIKYTGFVHGADLSRKFADETMMQAMIHLGVPFLKRWAVYCSVRAFGRRSFRTTQTPG